MYFRHSTSVLSIILLLLGLSEVYCSKKDNKKDKTTDLIAEATLYEPSYQSHYQPPTPVEHSTDYKKYAADHDSYGKYDKAYGYNGYNHYGNQDHYVDHGYADHALKKYNDYGSKDKYGGQSAHYSNDYGNGLYTRDRGYGYEKHYAYDKELATKAYSSENADKKANYGDHAKYDHSGLYSHGSSGHHKSGANKKYQANGYNKYGHNNGAYGDHHKHYGASGKALHLSTPYTHYSSNNYEPQIHYEPVSSYPNYPAYKPEIVYKPDIYKPDIYQQSYHDEPAVYPSSIQSTYISHTPNHNSNYPSASTSYASSASQPLHPGVAYY